MMIYIGARRQVATGLRKRASDEVAVLLCRFHHRAELERPGRRMVEKNRIDPIEIARELCAQRVSV